MKVCLLNVDSSGVLISAEELLADGSEESERDCPPSDII